MEIDLATLIAVHLHTHSCTSRHAMREKYRSAIYTTADDQRLNVIDCLAEMQVDFNLPIITEALPLVSFRENEERYRNYYLKNAQNQFCTSYIHPKLNLIMRRFSDYYIDVINTE